MQAHQLSLQEVKETDMVDHLKSLGHQPQRSNGNDYWYLSPLHQEHAPSFKVNRQQNCWFDHSSGRGGNLVDFLLLYHQCTIKEVLQKMKGSLSFHQQKEALLYPGADGKKVVDSATKMADQSSIKIKSEKPITNSFLLSYLSSRNIPVELAQTHLKEVHYELPGKSYYALGFKNDSGGYELRNKYFKGSSSPKDVTTIISGNNEKEVSVFEGFFSFLSYLSLQEKQSLPLTNFLVLNSLSLFNKNIELIKKYETINLYLDNDLAGGQATAMAMKESRKCTDERRLYRGHKDLNEWLIQQNGKPNQRHRLRL